MAAKPMTAADVSRLLGRAAFGATAHDLDAWTGKEYGDLVDSLLTVTTLPARPPLPDDAQRLLLQSGQSTDADGARMWWLERMRTTPFPLLERLTLLWHGHFATGVRYPPTLAQLVRQNETLRTHALGSLRDLVAAVTLDPAMLFWLNGVENAVPNPNENYAREFFELFTLGKRPQVHTERDIREAARVFTGWYVDANDQAVFAASRHDQRSKKVLGRTIANAGDQEYARLVDVALARPEAAAFVAWKLVANLAYVPGGSDPLVRKVAKSLRDNDLAIAPAVRTLLLADEFRYAKGAHALVRQPVEAVVHAAKAFGVAFADASLVWPLEEMGQTLFDPVNVGGWPLGADWISPVTALARYEAALTLYTTATRGVVVADPLPAAADLAGWAHRLGLAGFSTNTTNAVRAYLRRTAKNGAVDQQAGVAALLLCSPEWVVL
ncbi:MAG TPA: DUF1800 domain-containing protein [Mycobacteriales bacterium]|jgi:uncharacterized protein (DUF1800 family)|nr:DUF1800 domain-containing protein [Mycobacteriales bacterium]